MTISDLFRSTVQFKSSRRNPPKISVSKFEITSFPEQSAGLLSRVWKRISGVMKSAAAAVKKQLGKETPVEPKVESRMIMVKSVARSEVGAGYYNTYLLAKGIDVSTAKDGKHKSALSDGLFAGPIKYSEAEVKVRCDCPDFRWRFAWYNDKHGALYGVKPPPYKRKTNRPPVNPKQLPGMCKHLMNQVKVLASRHVIQ